MASRITRRSFVKGVALAAGTLAASTAHEGAGGKSAFAKGLPGLHGLPAGYPLPPGYPALPLYQDPLPIPAVYTPDLTTVPGSHYYEIAMTQFNAFLGVRDLLGNQVLTPVFGYGGVGPTYNAAFPATYPGLTFEARTGTPIVVKWINNLPASSLFPIDDTLHDTFDSGTGPGTQFPLRTHSNTRTVVHLHGAFVAHKYDGWPFYWFTNDPAGSPNSMTLPDGTLMPLGGPAGNYALYEYTNMQSNTTLWYHDHAVGITRFNIYSGLAGFYLVRDPNELGLISKNILPSGSFEIPLLIQDRTFNVYQTDPYGELVFDINGNPIVDTSIPNYGALHYNETPPTTPGAPYTWWPEMFADTALVNGAIRPYLNVQRRAYRFRILNGCNARVMTLNLQDPFDVLTPPSMVQIGSDGGLMPNAVAFQQPGHPITLMSSERADILIDFSNCAPGSTFVLLNTAAAPYPDGGVTDPYNDPIPNVTDILQFRVCSSASVPPLKLPSALAASPVFGATAIGRYLALNDYGGTQLSSGVNGLLINNVFFDVAPTIKPVVGTTEEWHLVNLAPDAHPVHVHLVKFQIRSRLAFIGPSIDDDIDTTQRVHPHPLDPTRPYAPLRWGGVKQFLFDNDLAQYDPVAQDIAYDDQGTQLLLNGGRGYRSGMYGMSGKFWDPTGSDPTAPPTPLPPPPLFTLFNGKYLYLTGVVQLPDANEDGWKDTVRADKNYVTTIKMQFAAPPGVTYTDPVTNELTGERYPIHCHILDHEDNDMMTSFALQPPGTKVQAPRV